MICRYIKIWWQKRNMVTKKIINSKKVYITEKHHHNLIHWAQLRQGIKNNELLVLSLDHHTDIYVPFQRFAKDSQGNYDPQIAIVEINKMDFNNIKTIENAIPNLRNDEHIETALRADIIYKFFIIAYKYQNDQPLSNEQTKYTAAFSPQLGNFNTSIPIPIRPYTYPDADIYIPENNCFVGCPGPHVDRCVIPHFNQCIESIFLNDQLDIMGQMSPSLIKNGKFSNKYILDIDLDYFHTTQSIHPKNTDTFYRLIKNAEIITITKEADFIAMWREEHDSSLNVNDLVAEILIHIKNATT